MTLFRLTSPSPLPYLPLPTLSSVDAATGTPVYGCLTCALEMKVYEGPFAVAAEEEGWAGSLPGERLGGGTSLPGGEGEGPAVPFVPPERGEVRSSTRRGPRSSLSTAR